MYFRYITGSLVMIMISFFSCKNEDVEKNQQGPVDTYNYPEGHITFQSLRIALEGVYFFEPMGFLDVFPKDHGGFHHREILAEEATIPIYAMADGQIIHVGQGGEDYYMTVKYSTTISTRPGHVGRFSDWIIDEIGVLNPGENKEVFVPVHAGDTIGYVCTCSAFDLGVHDQSLELNYLYPELAGFENRYAASPLDYYEDPLRSEFANIIMRSVEPLGGKVDYDIRNTISGNWYLENEYTGDIYANHLAIAYDHIHGRRVAVTDGYLRYAEGKPFFQLWIKGNEPKPEDVGPGEMIKYKFFIPIRWVYDDKRMKYMIADISTVDQDAEVKAIGLLELRDVEELTYEIFIDKTADEVTAFTENARKYVRNPAWLP